MRKSFIGLLAGALALLVAGIAVAGTSGGIKFKTQYTTHKSLASSGFSTDIDSNGTRDSTGKPKPTRTAIVAFQKGTKFNTSVKPVCTKSTLQSKGPGGCPPKSTLGAKGGKVGTATAEVGLPAIDPVKTTIYGFNKKNGILFYVRPDPGQPGNPFVLDGKIRKNVLTVPVPKLPQPTPFGEAILTDFKVNVRAFVKGHGKGAQFYAQAPKCPSSHKWTVKHTAVYESGPPTKVSDTTTCK